MKKKILSIALVAVMALALAGCGKSKESSSDKGEKKVYKIATDTTFAPMVFEDDNGNQVGIDMDLLAAIAEDQGFEYELQILGFNAAVVSLESGQSDAVIAGMSIREDRIEKYDFSTPYFDSGVGMGVRSDSGITSYEDLAGKSVAAKLATDGAAFAEENAEKYGYTVTIFEDSTSMYQDVMSGNSVACFEDYPVIGYEITRGLDLNLPVEMEMGSRYGFAVLKGENAELLELFNAGLENMKANGTYDEIINRYISK